MSRTEALKVACKGDTKVVPVATYNIPLTHEIFTEGTLSVPSQVIGQPLVLQRLRPSLVQPTSGRPRAGQATGPHRISSSEDANYYPNEAAVLLMANDQAWLDAGTILVARQDKLPLRLFELQVIMRYLSNAWSSGSAESAIPFLNPQKFNEYYDMRKNEQSPPQSALVQPQAVSLLQQPRVDSPMVDDQMEVDDEAPSARGHASW